MASPRDLIADTKTTYDAFFAQHGLNPDALRGLVYFNDFYMRYQPVNIARQTAGIVWSRTVGRPMGNALFGPTVANTVQVKPSPWANPHLPSGQPDSIVGYAKSTVAAILRRHGRI